MTNIKTDETWVLWPTKICPSFYDLAGNQLISGNHNFTLEFEFRINRVNGERGTILSVNPNYFVLHYYDEYLSAVHMANNESPVHNLHQDIVYTIKLNQIHKLKIVNLDSSDFFVYIDGKKVVATQNFVTTNDAQIFLGSETFPWNSPDLNSCDMDLFDFKLYHNDVLVCHHDFNNIIHNKFVDLTNNCNFIHKL